MENYLHGAARLAQALALQALQRLAVEQRTAADLGAAAQELEQALAHGGLAAAGLPHQRQGAPTVQAKAHTVYRFDMADRALQ